MGPWQVKSTQGSQAKRWIEAFRLIVGEQRELFASIRGIAARAEYVGELGEGGDRTLVIDAKAEDIVFAARSSACTPKERASRRSPRSAVRSSSATLRRPIASSSTRSTARSTHAARSPRSPSRSRLPRAPRWPTSDLGFVHDFGAGEEFTAERGAGARLDGERLSAHGPGYGLELVGLEASKPELIGPLIEGLRGKAYRCRSIGALAITLCYVAAGRFDGMLGGRPCRSVDVAAAQLIACEAGASLVFGELALDQVPLDLAARYDVAAGRDQELLGILLEVQRGAAAPSA